MNEDVFPIENGDFPAVFHRIWCGSSPRQHYKADVDVTNSWGVCFSMRIPGFFDGPAGFLDNSSFPWGLVHQTVNGRQVTHLGTMEHRRWGSSIFQLSIWNFGFEFFSSKARNMRHSWDHMNGLIWTLDYPNRLSYYHAGQHASRRLPFQSYSRLNPYLLASIGI